MSKTIKIWGCRKGKTEKLDETETLFDARRLVHEYSIAYGSEWRIWYGNKEVK